MTAEVLPQLFGQHLDRVWRDSWGDLWFVNPNCRDRWVCVREDGTRAWGLVFPTTAFGPYTDVTGQVEVPINV